MVRFLYGVDLIEDTPQPKKIILPSRSKFMPGCMGRVEREKNGKDA